MFKKIMKTIIIVGMVFIVTACGNENNNSRIQPVNNVDNVLEQQIDIADKKTDEDNRENTTENETIENRTVENETVSYDIASQSDKDVDIDLTGMGSDMVYATVYQLMVNPNDYIGKTIKMDGLYYATWYEPTQQYYHYVLIQDALACCATGIEFVWEDGNHVYPDEYPAEQSEVVVVGQFETYREDGDENLYCRLSNAVLEVK